MNIAAIFGASGVTLGAFGAHYLKKVLEDRNTVDTWKTAVSYQLFHAIGILALSKSTKEEDQYRLSIQLWSIGICLFSGSLYGLSLGGSKLLGPITPIGGIFLISGWLALLKQ